MYMHVHVHVTKSTCTFCYLPPANTIYMYIVGKFHGGKFIFQQQTDFYAFYFHFCLSALQLATPISCNLVLFVKSHENYPL